MQLTRQVSARWVQFHNGFVWILDVSCPTKGPPMAQASHALLPPREPTWGPGTHNTQHGHREAGGGAGMSCQGQGDGRKALISSAAFHNTLASVTKPSCWVLPPASALLPCAGVHDSLLCTQLLPILLCKLHQGERKHLRWHLLQSTHLTRVSSNNLLLAQHHTEMCSTGMGFAHATLLPRANTQHYYMLIFSNSMHGFCIIIVTKIYSSFCSLDYILHLMQNSSSGEPCNWMRTEKYRTVLGLQRKNLKNTVREGIYVT